MTILNFHLQPGKQAAMATTDLTERMGRKAESFTRNVRTLAASTHPDSTSTYPFPPFQPFIRSEVATKLLSLSFVFSRFFVMFDFGPKPIGLLLCLSHNRYGYRCVQPVDNWREGKPYTTRVKAKLEITSQSVLRCWKQ